MKVFRLAAWFTLGVLLAGSLPLLAQRQAGAIVGSVVDPQGAVVPGASITVRDVQTNARFTTTADDKGNFTVERLTYGVYSVVVEARGFRRWEALGVRVVTGETAIVRAVLEIGAIAETVTVEAASEVVNTVSPELQHNVSRQQILGLPLPTGNPVDFVSLQPGFQSPAGIRSGRIHGLRGQTNNITQDGINAQDNFVRTDGQFALTAPTVQHIGEISISTGTVGSDSGAGVAQIRFTTQKGTNDYHGSAFYNHRNDFFNANTWTNNRSGRRADGTPVAPRERLRQHVFGGTFGGPIWLPRVYNGKDRTFFFGRYEGFRENFAATRNRTVLTPAARTGMFTYTVTCTLANNNDGVTQAGECPVGINPGQQRTVTLVGPGSLSTNSFGFNPVTVALINATPAPNNSQVGDGVNTQGFQFNVTGSDPDDRYTLRFDHKLIDSKELGTHWLEVVWNWNKFFLGPDTFNSLEAIFPRGVAVDCVGGVCDGAFQASKRKLLAVALNSQLTPTMFNEARGGWQRAPVEFSRDAAFPRSFRLAFPLISTPEQNFLDQGRITPFYTFLDNFSLVKGSHTLKMGFDYSSTSGVAFNDAGIIPQVTLGSNAVNGTGLTSAAFSGGIGTGDFNRAEGLYAALTGLMSSVTQTLNIATPTSGYVSGATRLDHVRERAYMGYFMDVWRVVPSLTLTLGTRYEYVAPADTVNALISQPVGRQDGFFSPYEPFPIFSVDPSVTYGQILAGTAKTTQQALAGRGGLWNADRNNFAPSLGIAYSPNSDNALLKALFGKGGKGALRAGFSTSFTRDGLTVVTNARTTNTHAQVGVTDRFPVGVVGPTGAPLALPTLVQVADQVNAFRITGGGNNIFTFQSNLRTPYVLQWSFGLEREILPDTRFEVRYVGNHAVKLLRGLDLNQISVLNNGMLDEFNRALTNFNICSGVGLTGTAQTNARNACVNAQATAGVPSALRTFNNWGFWGLTGQQALPIISQLGANTNAAMIGATGTSPTGATLVATGLLNSSDRVTNLTRGEVGEWTHQVSNFAALQYLGVGLLPVADACDTAGACAPGLAGFPVNFFRANPFLLNGIIIGNHSHSNHHGLELEVFRRFSRGFLLQSNYTFARTITDADGASQSEFFPHLSLTDPRRERTRASFDVTHSFNTNGIWEIPVGRGRRYLSGGWFGKVLEGWQVGGIWRWYSGRPQSIFAGDVQPAVPTERGTLNRRARSGTNEAVFLGGITAQNVCAVAGLHKVPQGAYWLPTEFLRNPSGGSTSGASTSLFANPSVGQLGDVSNRLKCDGPGFFRVDMNFVKRTYITEKLHFEFRAEFFNIFNHPNFRTTTQSFGIDSVGFGRVSSVDTPREIQFNARINF